MSRFSEKLYEVSQILTNLYSVLKSTTFLTGKLSSANSFTTILPTDNPQIPDPDFVPPCPPTISQELV